jgi:hypothetical protein
MVKFKNQHPRSKQAPLLALGLIAGPNPYSERWILIAQYPLYYSGLSAVIRCRVRSDRCRVRSDWPITNTLTGTKGAVTTIFGLIVVTLKGVNLVNPRLPKTL